MQLTRKFLIVGAGPAGIAAALQFSANKIKPTVIDVGLQGLHNSFPGENLYSLRKRRDIHDLLIGDNQFGLSVCGQTTDLPLKLSAPYMQFVTNAASVGESKIEANNFIPLNSYAKGGLANAWSCGLYQYDDNDLVKFPIDKSDLTKYYKALSVEAGIVGCNDDLTAFFGEISSENNSIKLSKKCSSVLNNYNKSKKNLNERFSFYLGCSRVATNYKNKDEFTNLELLCDQEYLYNPRSTVDKLISNQSIEYIDSMMLEKFEYIADKTSVKAFFKNIKTNEYLVVYTETLMIACGCINTSKIVLKSLRKFNHVLKVHDNPAINIPILMPRFIGSNIDKSAFGYVQLNSIWDWRYKTQGTFVELNASRRGDLIKFLPLSARQNIWLGKHIVPSMLALRIYYPSTASDYGELKLDENDTLHIKGYDFKNYRQDLDSIVSIISKLGGVTLKSLIKPLTYGSSAHNSCTLPMSLVPNELQCDKYGKLFGAGNVYIMDSSNFSSLPAKNNSLTIMANAMRIAEYISHKYI